jgi:hypothetical protein
MEIIIRIGAAVAAAVLSGLLWFFIYQDTARPPRGRVLVYGPSLKVLGFVCAMGFLAIGYFTWRQDGFESYVPFLICSALVLMGVVLFLEAGFVRIEYGERGIITHSPWRGRREIPWHAIIGYRYSDVNRWHIIETRNHGRIRLSIYLRGLPGLFTFMKDRVEGERPQE